ncbi:hypothetical protein SDC9_131857 [bioreactor metagenome]|uniref:Uncharacterized protein n=1 Tax=bioreactor metagenome TaxID=1076179 RepID=A0A645D6A6_9ZZZZ
MLLGRFNLLVREQTSHIHHSDAIVGIEGGELVSRTNLVPVRKVGGFMKVQGMQYEHRQSKVIDRIAISRKLLLDGKVLVDFRKKTHIVGPKHIGTTLQNFPDLRFNEEAVGVLHFCCIGKRVETDRSRSMLCQESQIFIEKAKPFLSLQVEVHLIITKGEPDIALRPIRKGN